MVNGNVVAIFIAPIAGGKMEEVELAEAIAGAGLAGDRYTKGASGKGISPIIEILESSGIGLRHASHGSCCARGGVLLGTKAGKLVPPRNWE